MKPGANLAEWPWPNLDSREFVPCPVGRGRWRISPLRNAEWAMNGPLLGDCLLIAWWHGGCQNLSMTGISLCGDALHDKADEIYKRHCDHDFCCIYFFLISAPKQQPFKTIKHHNYIRLKSQVQQNHNILQFLWKHITIQTTTTLNQQDLPSQCRITTTTTTPTTKTQ